MRTNERLLLAGVFLNLFLACASFLGCGAPSLKEVRADGTINDLSTFTAVPIDAVASNGTNVVTLVSAAANRAVIPVKLSFRNADNAVRKLYILDGTTVLHPIELPANSSCFFDNDHGVIRATKSRALQFKLDSGTTGVTVSGTALQ